MSKTILIALTSFLATSCINRNASKSDPKIVGGTEVENPGDVTMRSTVALMANGRFFCTGTLIGPNQVLSAAHCIDNSRNLVLGQGTRPVPIPGIRVITQVKHPRWTQGPRDVSIIIFEGTLPANLVPVAIAPLNSIADGANVVLAGYGVTGESREGGGILRKVGARIRNFDRANKEFYMQEGLGVGSCYGDSGGPAYINDNGKLSVIGATSRGSDCDSGDGVYGDVRYFQGWYKCVAKGAGKPLKYLANDSSNVDCKAGTIDTDVGPDDTLVPPPAATPLIHMALGGAAVGSANAHLYFSADKQAAGEGKVEYCLGGDSLCSAGSSNWLLGARLSVAGEKVLYKSAAEVALTSGMVAAIRWTKADQSQVLEKVRIQAK